MLRIVRSLLAVLLLGAALAAPAGAAPVWRAIEAPAASGGGTHPAVAFDAAGNALLTWRHDEPGFGFRQLRYAWRPRNGQLGPVGAISDYGMTSRSVAVGFTGEAIAAWTMDDQSVEVAVAPGPGQPFGPPQVVGRPDAESFFGEAEVAVDDLGNAVVAWMRYGRASAIPSGMMVATRTEGGAFSPPQELGPAGFGGVGDVAMNGDGLAAVTWNGPDGMTRVALRQPGAAAFEAPVSVGLNGPGPSVAVGPEGTVVVQNKPGASGGPMSGPGAPALVTRPPGGSFGGPIEPGGGGRIVIDRDGTIRVVSAVRNLQTNQNEGMSIVLRGGAVAGTEPIGVTDWQGPVTAVARDGRAVAGWALPSADGRVVPTPIRFAERGPGEPFGAVQEPPGSPSGTYLATAISDLGSIALAWAPDPSIVPPPTQQVRLLVREDPDAVPRTRPTAPRAGDPPAPPAPPPPAPPGPFATTSIEAPQPTGFGVRVLVSCPNRCGVRADLRAGGTRLGRTEVRRLGVTTRRAVALRAEGRARRRVAQARRQGLRVVARVTLSPVSGPVLVRRVPLRR